MTEQAEQTQTSGQRAALEDSLRDFLARRAGLPGPAAGSARDQLRRVGSKRRVGADTGG